MCPVLEHRNGSKIRILGDVDNMLDGNIEVLVLSSEDGNEIVRALDGQTGFTKLNGDNKGSVNGWKKLSIPMFPKAKLNVIVNACNA